MWPRHNLRVARSGPEKLREVHLWSEEREVCTVEHKGNTAVAWSHWEMSGTTSRTCQNVCRAQQTIFMNEKRMKGSFVDVDTGVQHGGVFTIQTFLVRN